MIQFSFLTGQDASFFSLTFPAFLTSCVSICECVCMCVYLTLQHSRGRKKARAKKMMFLFACCCSPVCVFLNLFLFFLLVFVCDRCTSYVDSCPGLFNTFLSQGWWLMALKSTDSRKRVFNFAAVSRLSHTHMPSPCIYLPLHKQNRMHEHCVRYTCAHTHTHHSPSPCSN